MYFAPGHRAAWFCETQVITGFQFERTRIQILLGARCFPKGAIHYSKCLPHICTNDSYMHRDHHVSKTTKKTPVLPCFERICTWHGNKAEKWTSTCLIDKRNPQKVRFEWRGKTVLVIPLLWQETRTFSTREVLPHFTKGWWILIIRESVLALPSW